MALSQGECQVFGSRGRIRTLGRGAEARAPAPPGSGGPAASISPAMSAEPARDEVLPDEPVTMDKIVSLAKRRGFVFPARLLPLLPCS